MKLGPRQKKWIRDLPKYAKAKSQLYKKGVGFCCLGVYADTQVSTPWEKYPPSFLMEKDWRLLGLRNEMGSFSKHIKIGGRKYVSLVELNDRGPFQTHSEMADFINKHANLIFTRSA